MKRALQALLGYVPEALLTQLWIVALTLFSFIPMLYYSGYQVFFGIHQLYVPLLLHEMDSSLFTRDFSLFYNQSVLTLFDEFVLRVQQLLDTSIPQTFFILEFLSRLLCFGAILHIAKQFLHKHDFWFLTPLFFVPMITSHGVFAPEALALGLGLSGLLLMLLGKEKWAFLLFGVLLFLHPITALYFLAFGYGLLLYNFYRNPQSTARVFFVATLPLFCLLLYKLCITAELPLFERIDSLWRSSILMNSGLFTSLYSALLHPLREYSYSFMFLAEICVFFLYFRKWYNHVPQREGDILLFLLITPPILSFVQFVGVSALHLSFVAGLQLLRSFVFWHILVILLLLLETLLVHHSRGVKSVALWGLLITFSLNLTFLYSLVSVTFFLLCVLKEHCITTGRNIPGEYVFMGMLYGLFGAILVYKKHPEIWLFLTGTLLLATVLTLVSRTEGFFKRLGATRLLYGGNVLFLVILGLLFHAPFTPHQSKEVSSLCSYIEGSTPKNSLFLTEPFVSLGRDPVQLFCGRSVFVNQVDGDQAILNRPYALVWQTRFLGAKKVHSDHTRLLPFVKHFGIDYLLSEEKLPTLRQPVFENGQYYLYQF